MPRGVIVAGLFPRSSHEVDIGKVRQPLGCVTHVADLCCTGSPGAGGGCPSGAEHRRRSFLLALLPYLDIQPFDFLVHRRQRDVQALGGFGLAPVALFEAFDDDAALEIVDDLRQLAPGGSGIRNARQTECPRQARGAGYAAVLGLTTETFTR